MDQPPATDPHAVPRQRVLLLGWDAADWTVIRPLMEAGRMPHLLSLVERGASGNLATLQPMLSPALWNSVATGKHADQHGIVGFAEPTPDGTGLRPVRSTSRQAKALWNLLSQQGRRSAIVNWFASHPAEPVAGTIVANSFADSAASGQPLPAGCVHPPEDAALLEELKVTPADLTPAQMRCFFLEALPEDDDPRLHAFARLVAENASVHNAGTWLAEEEDWDLLAVYSDLIDHAGHGFMEYRGPRPDHVSERDFAIYGNLLDRVYEYHDLMLGRWLELAGPETIVMIISDHGFLSGAARPLARTESGITLGYQDPLAWHRAQGVFVVAGPGIKSDELVHGASLMDIAPTVLTLLGLPVPEDFAGKVLTTIFSTPPQVQRCPSLEPPHPDDGVWRGDDAAERDPWAAHETLRQLADLGYIDAPTNDAAKAIAANAAQRRRFLTQVYLSTQRPEPALAELQANLRDQPVLDDHRLHVTALLMLGRIPEARAALTDALAAAPRHPQLELLDAWLLLLEGRSREGDALLDRLTLAHGNLPFVWLQVGVTRLHRGEWTEAEAAFRRVLDVDPDSAEAHDGLGVALRETGKVDDAIYEHMRAISLQHGRAQSHVNLALSLTRRREFDWAIRAFETAAELAPDEPFPHRCLARLYRRIKHDRDKARHHVSEVVRRRKILQGRAPGLSLGA